MAMIAALGLAAFLSLSASAQPGPAEPDLAPAAQTAAGARSPVAVTFEADPRVELLSVLALLARPEPAGPGPAPYAKRARRAFAPFAGHAAVTGLREKLSEEQGGEAAEIFLGLSDLPALAMPHDSDAAARAAAWEGLLKDVRDFSRRAGFARFYKANAAFYRNLAEDARREADRGLRPDSVTGYLRLPGAGRYRFILAPLLPRAMAANLRTGSGASARYLRIRSVDDSGGPARMAFDIFGAGSAHDVGHVLLDPLAAANRTELDAYAGLMLDGCAGSWSGCVSEHVDLAVTLRALAAERGEGAYEEMRRAYAWKYPYLDALCARLKEWEARPDGTFAAFYPRLTGVFREQWEARVRASAPDAKPPRPPRQQ